MPAQGRNHSQLDVDALTELLGRQLPRYMVPATIVPLKRLPLGPTGKINRSALQVPSSSVSISAGQQDSPEQTLLCKIVGDLIGIDSPALESNFFDLGGDSLLAARLASAVTRRMGKTLQAKAIFELSLIHI